MARKAAADGDDAADHHPQGAKVRAPHELTLGMASPAPHVTSNRHARTAQSRQDRPGRLVVGAIGVVFGDIGTSPLYTLKEAFAPHYGLTPDHANVLGILSLVFWALMLVVTLKYVIVIMRADNDGEGGIMALMALVQRSLPIASPLTYGVGILGIFGAALFFGDGVITPAISVLSAVEGLEVAAPQTAPLDRADHAGRGAGRAVRVPALRHRQGRQDVRPGDGGLVRRRWPCSGVLNIVDNPDVLQALNPVVGVQFFIDHGVARALHPGRGGAGGHRWRGAVCRHGPFRRASRSATPGICFVLPALVLNYFGQGALVLADPERGRTIRSTWLVPEWALYPDDRAGHAAAVIASQAVITGAFSVARQAIQLGYLPRMAIVHTSRDTIGQIYVPWVNWHAAGRGDRCWC